MYSFHNDIAIPLEYEARKAFGFKDRNRGLMFDADSIELGSFVEVMLMTLYCKNNYMSSLDIASFAEHCRKYFRVKGNGIAKDEAFEMFERFKKLLNTIEENNADESTVLVEV